MLVLLQNNGTFNDILNNPLNLRLALNLGLNLNTLLNILNSSSLNLGQRLILNGAGNLTDGLLNRTAGLRRGTTKLSSNSPLLKITLTLTRTNLNQLLKSQLIQRSNSPSLATALRMTNRNSANNLSLTINSPINLRNSSTMLARIRLNITLNITLRKAALGLTIAGALEDRR